MAKKRLTAKQLKDVMIDKLHTSCIDKPTEWKKLGLQPMLANKVKTLGDNFEERGGIYIPYFTLDGKIDKSMFRVRYLESSPKIRTNDKVAKYMQPAGIPPKLYLPPDVDWKSIASTPEDVIYITEGEFKAACASKFGFPTIGIGGVYGWKSSKRLLPMIPDFKKFKWKGKFVRDEVLGEHGREVILVFDADLKTNPMVQQALKELCDELLSLGAEPKMVFIEEIPEAPKTGLDDYIFHRGDEAFEKLIDQARAYSLAGNLMALNSEVVYVQKVGGVINLNSGQIMRPSDFSTHHFSNRHYWEETWSEAQKKYRAVKKPAAPAWLKWEHRNELYDIVYRPNEPRFTSDDCYNLWQGWGCQPEKGNIKPWNDLMTYVFRKDEKARQWFERWVAIQFQKPGVKLFSAVMMWSVDQGTGKTFIGEIIGSLFGDKNYMIVKQEDIKKQFNQWRATKQFILADEITGSDKRKDGDFLKALITNKRTLVDEKMKPVYDIYDITNYYFTSNHPDALYLERTDRRFFIWEITNPPRERDFYDKINDWLENGGREALFHYFLTLDLGDFSERDHAMITSSKEEMIHTSKSEIANWLDVLKDFPKTILRVQGIDRTADLYTTKQLTDLYQMQTGDTTLKPTGMGRKLKEAKFKWAHNGGYIRLAGENQRLVIARNLEKWENASPKECAQHYQIHNNKFDKKKKE